MNQGRFELSVQGVVVFDVNGLKSVNDTYGHHVGDELICGAADCIRKVFGSYGSCFRMGGDEFLVMVDKDARDLIDLLKELDSEIENWHGETLESFTISYGYKVVAEDDHRVVGEIIKEADEQMYQNKKNYYSNKEKDRRS